MTEYKPFKLTRDEMDSALWKKLKGHIENRLDSTRKENDFPCEEDKTSRLRGRISVYKELLELGELEE